MNLDEIWDIIERENIIIENYNFKNFKAIIIKENDCAIIFINSNLPSQEIKYIIAHELSHYFTGTYFLPYSDWIYIAKCEYKAQKWLVQQLIPKEELIKLIKKGITEVWELADYFEVPEEWIRFRLNLPDIQELKEVIR